MAVVTRCPQCGKGYKVKDEAQGKKVRCQACTTVFVAGADSQTAVSQPAVSQPAVSQPAGPPSTPAPAGYPDPSLAAQQPQGSISCPNCGQQYAPNAELIGQTVNCLGCQVPFVAQLQAAVPPVVGPQPTDPFQQPGMQPGMQQPGIPPQQPFAQPGQPAGGDPLFGGPGSDPLGQSVDPLGGGYAGDPLADPSLGAYANAGAPLPQVAVDQSGYAGGGYQEGGYQEPAPKRKKKRRSREESPTPVGAMVSILIGILMAGGGIAATWISYESANDGGTYTVFTGLIAVGAITAIGGIINLFRSGM